jgi:hypothetical protein
MSISSPIAARSFVNELEKISEQSGVDRVLQAGPGVGAVIGGTVGAIDPKKFDPGTIFKSLRGKGGTAKGRVVSGVLGAGLGATTGWLPSVIRDAVRAAKPRKGK